MKFSKVNFLILFFVELLFVLFFLRPNIIFATDCTSDADCNQAEGFGCWPNGWCCKCTCGNADSRTVGEFECESIPGGDRGGCTRCGPGPEPTDIQPTPVICCQGSNACPNIPNSRYADCMAAGCSWNSVCPKPVPTSLPNMWLCDKPGAVDPNTRCSQKAYSCPSPDRDGAYCFSTFLKCRTGCHLLPGTTITPKPQLELLTPCAQKGIQNALDTAIGCFPVGNRNEMLVFILRWALGVGGGISFLLIVYSAFLIMASGGNAERVKAGKELLTAAITGLILIILSVFILDFFGLRILRIPGL